jgi:hypothetical protein
MNAQSKAQANMALWNAVSTTDPAHTKKVNQRGGFTAISAHYQVMCATQQFGPVGLGWGYINGEPIWQERLCVVPVTVWHGDRSNAFGPVYGGAEWKSGDRIDSDAPKKAATDGLTKALSHLGFNADVFLGRFDDSKYVEELRREFAASEGAGGHSEGRAVSPQRTKLAGPYTSPTALQTAIKAFVHELNGVGDGDELSAFLHSKDSLALIEQVKRDKPDWWHGSPDMPAEFVPLGRTIELKEYEMAQQVADLARA